MSFTSEFRKRSFLPHCCETTFNRHIVIIIMLVYYTDAT